MGSNNLPWLAQLLSMPMLSWDQRGQVEASDAARLRLQPHPCPTDPVRALMALTGAPRLSVEAALQETAGRGVVELGGQRVILLREGQHRTALCAPPEFAADTAVLRRAAAADLAAAVTHELGNSVGAIIGWAQLARSSASEEARDRALAQIEGAAGRARDTARLMLDAVGAEQRDSPEGADLDGLVDELVDLSSPNATAAGVTLAWKRGPGFRAASGRTELFTIVWNLIQNAIEAAPDGLVQVGITRVDDDLLLTVDDDGPGLSGEAASRAFRRYFTTKATGTGLGLYLVQQTAENLGGGVRVERSPLGGARFVVRIPAVTVPAQGRFESTVVPRGQVAELRVLVVDDDSSMRELLTTAFRLQGAEVVAVGSGREALLETGPFDAALVDYHLPDTRGDELVRALRQATIAEAFVIISGGDLPSAEVLGDEAVDAWVRKPFELEDLVAAVRLVTRRDPSEAAETGT